MDSSSGSGEEGRVLICDLVPHQPNTVYIYCRYIDIDIQSASYTCIMLYAALCCCVQVIIGLVITKQSVHSFPDKKS